MLPTLGTTCLLLFLPALLYSAGATWLGARYFDARLYHTGRRAMHAAILLLSSASALLITAFLFNHFEINYVAEHSSVAMPLYFKLAGLWAGLDGSLLFWAWLLAIMSFFALRGIEKTAPRLVPGTTVTLALILFFFGVLLLFVTNPFTTTLEVPLDGQGLNPLLQAPQMVIHPPNLYLGYVSASIPFALLVAGLLTHEIDAAWLKLTRRWMLFCWFFLSTGNLLGMHWAYHELGWGGFWAWDPVENAAAMPWFTATALLHSFIVQEKRGIFRAWNAVLILLTFALTIFGTFLTRSGVVQSVHAFSNSTLGWYFGIFLLTMIITTVALIVWKRGVLSNRARLETLVSKEGAFLLNNLALVVGSIALVIGTMLPTLSEMFGQERMTVGPPFFNKLMAPFGVLLLFLLGFGPVISWRRAVRGTWRQRLMWPAIAGGLAIAAAWAWHVRAPFALGVAGAGTFALLVTLNELVRGVRIMRLQEDLSWFGASSSLFTRYQRRYGGYIVHLGMICMCVTFAGSLFQEEVSAHLQNGDTVDVHGYHLTFDGLRYKPTKTYEAIAALLHVTRGAPADASVSTSANTNASSDSTANASGSGHAPTTADVSTNANDDLYPARFFYTGSEQPTTEVAIRATWAGDLYTVLGMFDVNTDSADVRVIWNPLMRFLWLGAGLLILGTTIVVWPRRAKAEETVQSAAANA